jgi:hypothetical protein
MTLAEKLLAYAKKNPEGFTVLVKNGKIKAVKGTSKKRYVVSITNNDTISKIKQSFKKDYTGYAGGWYDKKSKKYYIDKNIVIGNKQKATDIARKHKQKAIFDLLKFKEHRITPTKKLRKKIIIIRNGKYYNTITGRYISKTTAKRYEAYFKKRPEGTLSGAYGGYKYEKDVPVHKLSEKTQKVFRKSIQLIKTKNVKGETIYYSPLHDKIVNVTFYKKLHRLDYSICNGAVKVRLYRLTRDGYNVYHVFDWKIDKRFPNAFYLENWIAQYGIPTMNCILNEVHKVAKKYKLGLQSMYGHIDMTYILGSGIDSLNAGRVFGRGYRPELQKHIRSFGNKFSDILYTPVGKLEQDTYKSLYINKVSVYIYADRNEVTLQLSRYREGVLNITNG